jgi:2-keto-4-pentenoate hydratase
MHRLETPLAQRLLDAHKSGAEVVGAPSPANVAAAMAEQRALATALGAGVDGWKVAIHPEAGPIAAPLLSHLVRTSSASWPYADGILIEIEIAVRLARDLPPMAYTRHAIIDAIGSVSVGVELVRSRLAPGAPFLSFLADNLGNAGYVVGAATPWTDFDPATLRCSLAIDGNRIQDAPCVHPQNDILAPLVAYAARPNDRLGGLKAGQIVTTGSLCGAIPLPRSGRLIAEIDCLGTVEIALA